MSAVRQGEHDGVLTVEVWSDVMCPFCYLGSQYLARAVAGFEHGELVQVRHRSYQLLPQLPVGKATDIEHHLVHDRGLSPQQVRASLTRLQDQGAQVGLDYRFDRVQVTNTRAALRLIHVADRAGRQQEAVRRLFRAYFTDGLDVGDPLVLSRLGAELGLDEAATRDAVVNGAWDDAVDADIRAAEQLGIDGVPFAVLGGRYGLSGAQPVETILDALRTAWAALGLGVKLAG